LSLGDLFQKKILISFQFGGRGDKTISDWLIYEKNLLLRHLYQVIEATLDFFFLSDSGSLILRFLIPYEYMEQDDEV